MSGRPEGNATQAERVLRIFLTLQAAAEPTYLTALCHDHGVGPRTIRRDLAVVRKVVHPAHDLVRDPEGTYRLVARGARR